MKNQPNHAVTMIPLDKLFPSPDGVRKVKDKSFVQELAASIQAHGLLQNLTVHRDGKQYAVLAGQHRLAALNALAKAGVFKQNHPVPCHIEKNGYSTELGLAENAIRKDMHPADLFEAFRKLIDAGESVPDVAQRFGRSEVSVQRLLRLAQVSPAILKAYRAGELSLAMVQAFAITDDTKRQEQVWRSLGRYNRSATQIRDALTEDAVSTSDRRCTFVTLKAYEEAGGAVRTTLFAGVDGEDGTFIDNPELLDRLVADKLQHIAKSVAREGWKWTEAQPVFPYEARAHFQQLHAEPAALPPEQEATAAALEQELESLHNAELEGEDEDAEPHPRIAEIEAQLDAIEDARGKPAWQPEQLACAGAVVTLGQDGKAEIVRGLVKPEDRKEARKTERRGTPASKSGIPGEAEPKTLSGALVEALTAQRSAALAAALLDKPRVALAALVHRMALYLVLDDRHEDSPVRVKPESQSLHRVEGSRAVDALEAARKQWANVLPTGGDGASCLLWNWCLAQEQDELLRLLAYCVARTVDAVQKAGFPADPNRVAQTDRVAEAAGLDMRQWWTATGESYFARVSKPQLLEALAEGTGTANPEWGKLKKAELAALADKELQGKGWLPKLLQPATAPAPQP